MITILGTLEKGTPRPFALKMKHKTSHIDVNKFQFERGTIEEAFEDIKFIFENNENIKCITISKIKDEN